MLISYYTKSNNPLELNPVGYLFPQTYHTEKYKGTTI